MSHKTLKYQPGLLVYPLSILSLLISIILLVSHLQTTPTTSIAYLPTGPLNADHVVSAVYVNLEYSLTRRNLMEARWRNKINNLARFPAVTAEEIIEVGTHNRFKSTVGEIALLTSTLRAFRHFIETDPTAHALLVMDDDVTDSLYATWIFSLEEVAELATKMAPQWGVVRLGYAYRGIYQDRMAFRFPFIVSKLRRVFGSFANLYSRAFIVKALELYPLNPDGFLGSVTNIRVDESFLNYVLQQSGLQELLLYPQMMQVDPLEWLTQTGVRTAASSSSGSLREAIDSLKLDYGNASHLASYSRALSSASMFHSITRSGELLGLGSTRDDLIALAHGYLDKWHPSLVNEVFNVWSGDYMKGGKVLSSWRKPSTPFYGVP
ncbi:MAG: hypothetical protein KVP17_003698 [Porospora cf. gigantea B]|uniref:uncharacterized protein n=2 Tax=Porospora cf. gigantea B TaxID=2853592 RepID=UPI003571F417|nr:MAG: hypothetical protein KVP17_003698 [Porospora cf. gigantea B]